MEANYVIILVGALLSMVIGFVWFGPLFGKKWMQIMGATEMDAEKRKEMQRAAKPLYIIQFALSLLQVYIFSNFITWNSWSAQSVGVAFFLWLGFVMPTVAGSAMWNNQPNKVKWALFLIQAGFQLVLFLMYGFLIGRWG